MSPRMTQVKLTRAAAAEAFIIAAWRAGDAKPTSLSTAEGALVDDAFSYGLDRGYVKALPED
jgi:hypothetical protein